MLQLGTVTMGVLWAATIAACTSTALEPGRLPGTPNEPGPDGGPTGDGATAETTGAPIGSPDAATADAIPTRPEPTVRLLAPISASTVTSARPRLRWVRATAASTELELCADRACTQVIDAITSDGTEATPSGDLPPGYWFWRARAAGGAWTPAWLLRVRRRFPGYAPQANTASDTFSDFNGDGYPDVAVAGSRPAIYLGGADGISPDRTLPLDMVPADSISSEYRGPGADMNGDGISDFGSLHAIPVDGQSWADQVAFIQFGGSAGLSATAARVEVIDEYYPPWVSFPSGLGDFDGDGFGDMFITAQFGALLLRGGSPTPPPTTWNTLDCGSCELQSFLTGDFNGDGRTDVAYGSGNGVEITLGNPDNTLPTMFFALNRAEVIDFNYDGYSDLIVYDPPPATSPEAYEGGPRGLSATPSMSPQPPAFIVAGDFDGDGYWDVIVASSCGYVACPLVVYGGPAGWPFARTTPLSVPQESASLEVVDLNADGYDDVLVTGPVGDPISWYAGSAAGLAGTPSVRW